VGNARRGLTVIRRRRAVIQLASSLRNLGELDEALELLSAERYQRSLANYAADL
jgi:hypothetical protein